MPRFLISALALPVLGSFGVGGASAQTVVPQGTIRSIGFDPHDPDRAFVGGGVGVYRTEDGGSSWQLALGPRIVWSFAVGPAGSAPAGGDVVLAATQADAVMRSADGGRTWSADPGWQETVRSVVIRADGSAAYAGTADAIHVSDDHGQTWRVLSDSLGTGVVEAIVLVDGNPNLLFVAKQDQGVYRSVDGGVSWLLGNDGLDDSYLVDLDVDPSDPAVLYASALSAVYRSVDAGASWVELPFPDGTYELEIDPTQPARMFVASTLSGIHRSLDGGNTWVLVSGEISSEVRFFTVALAPDGSGHVYAGAEDYGLFVSEDFGDSWSRVGGELPPPTASPPPGSTVPNLSLSVVDLQGGDSVASGSPARYRLVLENTGGATAVGVRLHAGWVRLPFLVGSNTPMPKSLGASRGSCDSAGECTLGDLAPGADVTIEFYGTTTAGVLGNYRLSVQYSADNAGGSSVLRTIGTRVTVFSSDSGGGAIGVVELLALSMFSVWCRRRGGRSV